MGRKITGINKMTETTGKYTLQKNKDTRVQEGTEPYIITGDDIKELTVKEKEAEILKAIRKVGIIVMDENSKEQEGAKEDLREI